MKILVEGWRRFLTERVAGGPGDPLGDINNIGRTLYRISRRHGIVQSRKKPQDRDYYYTNKFGDIEHRIYFFTSKDEALGHFFSDVGELYSVVGDFEANYDISELTLTSFDQDSFPTDVQLFQDPEFENSSAIYGSLQDGEPWEIEPDSTENAMSLIDDEDDYYENF